MFVDPEPVSVTEPRQRLATGKFLDFIAIPLMNSKLKPSQNSSPVVMLNVSVVRMGDELETSELADVVLGQKLM